MYRETIKTNIKTTFPVITFIIIPSYIHPTPEHMPSQCKRGWAVWFTINLLKPTYFTKPPRLSRNKYKIFYC